MLVVAVCHCKKARSHHIRAKSDRGTLYQIRSSQIRSDQITHQVQVLALHKLNVAQAPLKAAPQPRVHIALGAVLGACVACMFRCVHGSQGLQSSAGMQA